MLKTKEAREYTEYEKKLHEYYWKCFISEVSKIVIFFLIFVSLKLTDEYIAALLALMLLRNNGGGLHFNHYTSCLLVSFTFLLGSILLAHHIIPTAYFMNITTGLCSLGGYFLAPITSTNRPEATPEQVRKSKKNSAIIITGFLLLANIVPHNTYIYIGYWTIILHILQLFIAKKIKEVKQHVVT